MNYEDIEKMSAKESLRTAMVFDSRDWSATPVDAWVYGIVVGWDEASMVDLRARYRWSLSDTKRLERLHKEFSKLG